MITLQAEALTTDGFAPYGDVIEALPGHVAEMNADRFQRFDDLCTVEAIDGHVAVSIARCRIASQLPYRIDMVERHPQGSQAFVPLTRSRLVVVVAPPGDSVDASRLRAFVTNGKQGINYHRGTWHMPLIAFDAGQEFLIIDRVGETPNCDIHKLSEPVTLLDRA